jgi:cytidine deaminase
MLNDEQRMELVRGAGEARKGSYSPYSNYAVGATLLSKSGKVYTGANVENAVYPMSLCAERVAVFKAVSSNDRDFEAIAVVTRDGGSPCGACRQVLSEFGLETVVLIANESGKVLEETTVGDLLPGAFGPSNLES